MCDDEMEYGSSPLQTPAKKRKTLANEGPPEIPAAYLEPASSWDMYNAQTWGSNDGWDSRRGGYGGYNERGGYRGRNYDPNFRARGRGYGRGVRGRVRGHATWVRPEY